ncbi:PREDICTED: uncharacterized protein LOC104827536 [Tarenaya hassleriana]|uniref:uncharacterized protein LOC104827536 n=1 Tax=Tarenaya hassleriana TaxID=28532 RepID=UPI00053CA533|nr:PREDICTED: uncharacterized protein LOC104827536 [Tarenaya hassleriana]
MELTIPCVRPWFSQCVTKSSGSDKLVPLDPEIEKSAKCIRKKKKQQKKMEERALAVENDDDTYGAYLQPKYIQQLSCIRRPDIDRNKFEFQPAFISMLSSSAFRGRPNEDPILHLTRFKLLCQSVKTVQGVTDESLMLMGLKEDTRVLIRVACGGSLNEKSFDFIEQQITKMVNECAPSHEFVRSISFFKDNRAGKESQSEIHALRAELAKLRMQGSLPGNPKANPREHCNAISLRSGKELVNPIITSTEKGQCSNSVPTSFPDPIMAEKSTEISGDEERDVYIPPPPHPPPVPFPQRLKKNKEDTQFARFADMVCKLKINMPFHEVITQMPSYAKFLKDILTKKRVIKKETITLNPECNAILKHDLPPKMSDLGSFSIPCKLRNVSIDRTLCDLAASVSLLPLSIYKKLSVGELKQTRMALQLADRSVKYPLGILEDVPLKVSDYYVPIDFVVLDMDEDSKIPIILGRPFLNTADAIVYVRAGRLTLKIGDETLEFKLDQNFKQPSTVDSICYIDPAENAIVYVRAGRLTLKIGDETLEFKLDQNFKQPSTVDSICYIDLMDALADEYVRAGRLTLKIGDETLEFKLDQNFKQPSTVDSICYIDLMDALADELGRLLTTLRDYRKAIGYTLDDIKGLNPSLCMHQIHLEDDTKSSIEHQHRLNPSMKEVVKKEEKTTFTCPYGTFVYLRMPFGLCNAPATFQRCMMAILSDIIEDSMEVFMDDFSVHGPSFDASSSDTRSPTKASRLIKAKIEVIEKLPPPHNVKAIRSFLGHAAFETLKKALIFPPIIQPPNWDPPFEIMCDASDYVVGVVLGQRWNKVLHAIYYASRTLDDAQVNYTTTEKELLAVVFAFEKFRSYLVGSKVIVYTDYAALRYLLSKKDAKPHLIRWILLLQEFDLDIRDKKGAENEVADHLSRLELPEPLPIDDNLRDEHVFTISTLPEAPWYADYVNYLFSKILPPDLSYNARKKFLHDVRDYYWDDPFLFKRGTDDLFRHYIPEVDYVTKWVEVLASPTNNNKTVVHMLKRTISHD